MPRGTEHPDARRTDALRRIVRKLPARAVRSMPAFCGVPNAYPLGRACAGVLDASQGVANWAQQDSGPEQPGAQ